VVTGLVAYVAIVGLDRAEKLISLIGVLVAVIAVFVPYLFERQEPDPDRSRPPEAGRQPAAPQPAPSGAAGRPVAPRGIEPWSVAVSLLVGVFSVVVMMTVTDDWFLRLPTGVATGLVCWLVSAAVGSWLDGLDRGGDRSDRGDRAPEAAVPAPPRLESPEVSSKSP
jgi:hypothetical protein